MDSLFNRNTDGVTGSESAEPNTASQHAASDVPATVVNPLYAGESAGERAMSAGTSASAPDTRAYVAEPAPQQTVSTKEHDDKQPSRAANLLLVATLAAVCGLAGMQGGGMPGADGTTGDGTSEGTANGNAAPDGQAPTGTPDAGDTADTSADGSNDAAGDTSTDAVNSHATSQTSLSV